MAELQELIDPIHFEELRAAARMGLMPQPWKQTGMMLAQEQNIHTTSDHPWQHWTDVVPFDVPDKPPKPGKSPDEFRDEVEKQ